MRAGQWRAARDCAHLAEQVLRVLANLGEHLRHLYPHAQAEVSSRSALGSAHARPAPEQRRALFARSVLWAVARAGVRRAKVAGGERGGGGLSRASHGGLWCLVFVRAGRTDDCSSWTLRGGRGSCLQSSVDSQSAKVLVRAAESRSPQAAKRHEVTLTSLQSKESFLGATGQAATRVGATAG